MKRISNVITAVSVTLFIAVMLVLTLISAVTGEGSGNAKKGSTLSTVISLVDGSIGEKITKDFAGSFSGRIDWVAIDAKTESAICENIVNGVYIADSRLIEADNTARTVSEKCASSILSYTNVYDGAVCLVAVPGSAGVYSELLPEYMDSRTQKQLIDRFYELLDTGVRRIDAYNRLKMLSDNYVYFRSDNKWTSYGAYCVYRTVIQKLGFQPISYDKYSIEHAADSYCGDLYSRTQYMHCSPDLLDIYTYDGDTEVTGCTLRENDGTETECPLYNRDALRSDNMYALYPGVGHPMINIRTSNGNGRKLLVIGDDYAASFVPFLLQHYSEVTVIYPEHTTEPLSSYTDNTEYERTLFLFGIDSLCGENILEGLLSEYTKGDRLI